MTAEWAEKLGLRAGIPIPVGAFDAHWDAIGSNIREGDVVNVVGTSTCIIAMAKEAQLVPGVCGVVPGSVHPQYTGIEAGLSAVGDIFDAIARRADTTVAALSEGLDAYKAGQTGLLRLSWDNGDRTVLVNPELGGVTLGWNLVHTAQDELFAAIEGTAFHTRIILERMAEHGVRIDRVINAGGIPQKSEVLNRVYANVLNKPVLVPAGIPTSLGSGIFALLAAGAYKTIEEAQAAVCLPLRTVEPDAKRRRCTSGFTGIIAMCTLRWASAMRRRWHWDECCRSCGRLRPRCRRRIEGCGIPGPKSGTWGTQHWCGIIR